VTAIVRPIKPEDHAFIYATWLRQLWFDKNNATLLPKATFMRLKHNEIEGMLRKGTGLVGKIVCSNEDPDLIYGYRVGSYSYFKKAFRGIGLEELI
jgi:hypothetical protein